jgi:HPt (histidine-containing phosphotransfer) domain-containing protein
MTIADQPSQGTATHADAAARGLLDVADGIGRVMGDRALYARMLRRFGDDYRNGAAPIRGAIGSGDLRLAHRMAHTLKGASGMISAPALHRQASALEFALRHACPGQAELLDTLDSALAAVLRAIERVLAAEPAPDQPHPPPPPALQPGQDLVAQLAELLATGDGAAVDLLEQAGPSLKAALGDAGFGAVALAANEFDFEGALAALGRIVDGGRGTAAGP